MFTLPNIILPIWLLFLPFGFVIGLFLIYGLFNIYHLLRFATYNLGSYFVTVLFIGGAVILAAISIIYITNYDWTLTWNLTDFLEFKSVTFL
ncbi:TPA: hypothetical protein DEA21_01785 [Candidatus Uhrbacteria bacterium]|nr:hypothetical protein [Candidatus Uhrbacteria bacterium]HCU32128.1 hypothetical protein [Candidatus Uhrbacteria bacterium]